MRLNKNQIEHLAFVIVRNLTKEGKVLLEDKKKILPIGGLYKKDLYDRLNFI